MTLAAQLTSSKGSLASLLIQALHDKQVTGQFSTTVTFFFFCSFPVPGSKEKEVIVPLSFPAQT